MKLRLSIQMACLLAAANAIAQEGIADIQASLEAKLAERHQQAIALAELYEANGDWRRAAIHYEGARRFHDDDANVLSQLARLYRMHGERVQLLSVYEALVRLQPTSLAWLRELGSCHFEAGDPQKAEATWRRILEVQPSRVAALRYLGQIYSSHQLGDKAIAAYREALSLAPRDEDILMRVAEALGERGDHLGALAALSEAGPARAALRSQRAARTKDNAILELALPRAARAALEKRLEAGGCSVADLAWEIAQALEAGGEGKRAAPLYLRVATEEPDTARGKAAAEKARRLAPNAGGGDGKKP